MFSFHFISFTSFGKFTTVFHNYLGLKADTAGPHPGARGHEGARAGGLSVWELAQLCRRPGPQPGTPQLEAMVWGTCPSTTNRSHGDRPRWPAGCHQKPQVRKQGAQGARSHSRPVTPVLFVLWLSDSRQETGDMSPRRGMWRVVRGGRVSPLPRGDAAQSRRRAGRPSRRTRTPPDGVALQTSSERKTRADTV